MHRRTFIGLGASAAAAWRWPGMLHRDGAASIKAILFDAFPIFDPTPVGALAGALFPGKGAELMKEWRTRQFEYTWLRSMTGCYADFQTITSEALAFAGELLQLNISPSQRQALVNAYLTLPVWPDVPPVLAQLRARGYRLGMLSNFTPEMLRVNVERNGIAGYFEHLISVDGVKRYKPDPLTYRMGMDLFHLGKEEILFVPFAGWDAAGAKSFGYTTFWVNRWLAPPERIAPLADGEGKGLEQLAGTDLLSHERGVG